MKEKAKKNRIYSNPLLKSVSILILTIALAVGVIYAWFIINDRTRASTDIKVIESSNIHMDIEIIDPNGTATGNLKFDNVLPGDVYLLKIKLTNFSQMPLNYHIELIDIMKAVIYYSENMENIGEFIDMSMLNVFAVAPQKIDADGYPINSGVEYPLDSDYNEYSYLCRNYDVNTDKVSLMNNSVLPPMNDSELTTITRYMKVQFMNEISDGVNKLEYAEVKFKDTLLGNKTVNVNINTFQKQKFSIGILKIVEEEI